MFHFHEDGKCRVCGALANISCDNCGLYVCNEHIALEIVISKNRIIHVCDECAGTVLKKMAVGEGKRKIRFGRKNIAFVKSKFAGRDKLLKE